MKNKYLPIIIVLVGSAVIIGLLALWFQAMHTSPTLDITEDGEEFKLESPAPAEELERINNEEAINTMNPTATFTTNRGTITLELFADVMPITTDNFIKLAEDGFYNNTKFHRVIAGFMIQGGDPNSKGDNPATYGQGGPGYTIQDEFVEDPRLTNTRGSIAMANTGQPNSGGSQFFINLVDNENLDFNVPDPNNSRHPVFGRVIDGMDIVDTIGASLTTAPGNVPVEPVIIESITITR
jgi:peptidylprolyl isomerase